MPPNPETLPDVPSTAPHILVVDDDTRLRGLLRKYLMENGYRVTTAADASDARAKMTGLLFDLLVLDVMMPGESGVDLTRALRRGRESLPILMLTARGEAEDRISGLEAGADDYLAKPFEPKELLLRINSILRRAGTAVRPMVVRFGDFTFEIDKGRLRRGDEVVHLTSGEATLLKALARNPGETVGRIELDPGSGDSQGRAVDVQITRLRRKIEDEPRLPRYLQTVRGEGYVLWAD